MERCRQYGWVHTRNTEVSVIERVNAIVWWSDIFAKNILGSCQDQGNCTAIKKLSVGRGYTRVSFRRQAMLKPRAVWSHLIKGFSYFNLKFPKSLPDVPWQLHCTTASLCSFLPLKHKIYIFEPPCNISEDTVATYFHWKKQLHIQLIQKC